MARDDVYFSAVITQDGLQKSGRDGGRQGSTLYCLSWYIPVHLPWQTCSGKNERKKAEKGEIVKGICVLIAKKLFFFTNILALLRSSDIKAAYCRKKGRVVIRTDIRH